jgi:lysophospholipase L1-like esterase
VLAAVMVAEAALQILQFHPSQVNGGYLQFGYPAGIPAMDEDGVRAEGQPARIRLFEPDPHLLWRPIANTDFTNSMGLRGRVEYAPQKPEGALRIVFLGDSCTFLGDPVYPEIVQRQLSTRLGKRVEALNASSPGYSSFQGRQLLEKVAAWQPDAVVVYFGWNDHWRAQGGLTDELQYALGHGPKTLALLRAVWARTGPPITRVPLERYAENLEAIRAAVADWGAKPIFVTAPSAFRSGAMPNWAYGFFQQFYGMEREAVDRIPGLHEEYAAVVRQVASRPPARLVDAATAFADSTIPSTQLFRTDSIHLRQAGHEKMAELVGEAVISAAEAQAPDPTRANATARIRPNGTRASF